MNDDDDVFMGELTKNDFRRGFLRGLALTFTAFLLPIGFVVLTGPDKAKADGDPIQRISDGRIEVYRDSTTGCEYLGPYQRSVIPRMETAPGGGVRHRGCRPWTGG